MIRTKTGQDYKKRTGSERNKRILYIVFYQNENISACYFE